jgi:(+)-neomenthol dehydrogenase
MFRKPQQVNNAGITGTEIKEDDWKKLRFGVEDVSLSK